MFSNVFEIHKSEIYIPSKALKLLAFLFAKSNPIPDLTRQNFALFEQLLQEEVRLDFDKIFGRYDLKKYTAPQIARIIF